MLTNTELTNLANPLQHAKELQDKIDSYQEQLDGLNIEFNQVVLFCREKNITEKEGYSLIISKKTTYKIDPKKFAKLFPDTNTNLIKKEIAFLNSEIKRIESEKVLSAINKKAVEKQVSKKELIKACNPTVSENTRIVKKDLGGDRK
jgi:hypothetical protein